MEYFWKGFHNGMATYGLVAGGAIGGMLLMEGMIYGDTTVMILGGTIILTYMIASIILRVE